MPVATQAQSGLSSRDASLFLPLPLHLCVSGDWGGGVGGWWGGRGVGGGGGWGGYLCLPVSDWQVAARDAAAQRGGDGGPPPLLRFEAFPEVGVSQNRGSSFMLASFHSSTQDPNYCGPGPFA